MPPISNPPTFARMSIGSSGSGLLSLMPFSITDILFFKDESFMPVPRPVTSSTRLFPRIEKIAELGVVLPIPISPVVKISISFCAAFVAISIPVAIAVSAWERVILGSLRKFLVPNAILRSKRFG